MTIPLIESARAWPGPGFEAALKGELEGLDPEALPLVRAMEHGSALADTPFTVTLLAAEEEAEAGRIAARVGVFFRSLVAGCQCADDPTPPDEIAEYCELRLTIDPADGTATVALLAD